ncbi:MAG: hypothetical protein KatS3mg131_1788 [Candidatus Tectimicrobiota bacterium]|nr:MAG: hypothetical protein KatS3mg131_1788 [Candidatus Tectomicrobia bacterium]
MLDLFADHSAAVLYGLLFLLLVLCGAGFPMAEELILLAGGVLVAAGVLHPLLMLLSTFLGVLAGDLLLFWLGRHLVARLARLSWIQRWLLPERLALAQAFFARHGNKAVFLARFVAGLRAPVFLLAGATAMSPWHFASTDLLASVLFVPAVCFLGYVFADRFELVAFWFRSVERGVLTLLALAALGWGLRELYGRRRRKRLPPSPPAKP